MTVKNVKEGAEDRIISVIPLSGEIGHGNLQAEASLGSSVDTEKPGGLSSLSKYDLPL